MKTGKGSDTSEFDFSIVEDLEFGLRAENIATNDTVIITPNCVTDYIEDKDSFENVYESFQTYCDAKGLTNKYKYWVLIDDRSKTLEDYLIKGSNSNISDSNIEDTEELEYKLMKQKNKEKQQIMDNIANGIKVLEKISNSVENISTTFIIENKQEVDSDTTVDVEVKPDIKVKTEYSTLSFENRVAEFSQETSLKLQKAYEILYRFKHNNTFCLQGGTGIGKSYIIHNIGKYADKPVSIFKIVCTMELSYNDITYKTKAVNGKLAEVKGKLVQANEYAKEHKDEIVVCLFEEVNHSDMLTLFGDTWEWFNSGNNGNTGVIEKLDNFKILMTQNKLDSALGTVKLAEARRKVIVDITWDDIDIAQLPDNEIKEEVVKLNDIIKGSQGNTDSCIGISHIYEFESIKNNCNEIELSFEKATIYDKLIQHMEFIRNISDNTDKISDYIEKLVAKAKEFRDVKIEDHRHF